MIFRPDGRISPWNTFADLIDGWPHGCGALLTRDVADEVQCVDCGKGRMKFASVYIDGPRCAGCARTWSREHYRSCALLSPTSSAKHQPEQRQLAFAMSGAESTEEDTRG